VVDAGAPAPIPLAPPAPVHRYEFAGSGRVARDSIGNADAELQGRAFLADDGEVQFGGANEDAVQLPPRILNGLSSFTLLGWLVPRTDECTQRLCELTYFNEGNGNGNGQNRQQLSALYVAPYACPDGLPATGYVTERMVYNVQAGEPLSDPRATVLLGAMYDNTTEQLQLIVDGVVVQQQTVPIQLRELGFAQGSLGRSSGQSGQNDQDNRRGGSIAEFRIYDRTLDAATLAEIARRGPDQL
jgi:hypothetical protein